MGAVITKRTALLVVVLGALAAWLAAAATSGVQTAHRVATAASPIDVRGQALAAEIERLHDRLRPTVAPEHGRNLFQFADTRGVDRAPAAALQAPPPPAPPAPPPFKLIGIAEDADTRTAILSAPNGVLLVKIGDAVGTTLRVTAISADAIELADTADGHPVRLVLQ